MVGADNYRIILPVTKVTAPSKRMAVIMPGSAATVAHIPDATSNGTDTTTATGTVTVTETRT